MLQEDLYSLPMLSIKVSYSYQPFEGDIKRENEEKP